MSANFNNSYSYWISEGYVTLQQSWRNFKYVTVITASTYDSLRFLHYTTVDIAKLIALDNYFKNHAGGGNNTNMLAYPWCEPWIVSSNDSWNGIYALFTLPFYGNRYNQITDTKIIVYTTGNTGILYIYGHNSL